jgi:hypothetical protein
MTTKNAAKLASLGKIMGRAGRGLGSALRHSPRLEMAVLQRAGNNAVHAVTGVLPGAAGALPHMGEDISYIVNAPSTLGGPAHFGKSGFPPHMGEDLRDVPGINAPMSIPRTLRPTAMPGADLEQFKRLNQNPLKQANLMQTKNAGELGERLLQLIRRHPATTAGIVGGAVAATGEAAMRHNDNLSWESQPLINRLKYLIDPTKRPSLFQMEGDINNPHPKMAHTTMLGLALALQDEVAKQAHVNVVNRELAALDTMVMQKQAAIAGVLSRLVAKAEPALAKGVTRMGELGTNLKPEGWASKILLGKKGRELADLSNLGEGSVNQVGNHMLNRVGPAAMSLGATGAFLGAESPGKMQNNAAYAEQEQHPIRSWLQQNVMGRKPLQHRSYLNPLG